MTELRFLRLNVPLGKKRSTIVSIPENIMPFSDKLRYLEWNGYPLKSLPQPFSSNLLVELRLPHSNVEHLWHGIQELVNLKGIDLSECKLLISLPDLSKASNLKWLHLSGCESLCEVKSSVLSSDTLVTLILDRCIKLQSLVSMNHLTSLKNIHVYGCSSLKVFWLSSNSIKMLDLSNTGIEKLQFIEDMSKLVWLNLEGLRLIDLPENISCLESLTELRLSGCDTVTKSKLEVLFKGQMRSLKILHLKDCGELIELPESISSLSTLYELRLDRSNVVILPARIKYLSKLEILSLDDCRNLIFLPELPPHIAEFHADNCTSLARVSTLKTFSKSMKGENKYISFKNDMELDEPSLICMIEDVILTMKSAAIHNISVKKFSRLTHSFNFNSVVVCLTGNLVPNLFGYKTMDPSSISLDMTMFFYRSWGFVYCVVVSPSSGAREYDHGVQIQCQYFTEDGRDVGVVSRWHHHKEIDSFNGDHVFLWYDPYHYESIRYFFSTVSFKFSVTTDSEEHDNLFSIKECGIYPIYTSELLMLLEKFTFEDEYMESYLRFRIREELKEFELYEKICQERETTSIY